MTLKSVRPGNRVIVKKLIGHGKVRRRLMDMGIIPGTEIQILKVAPLGDPVEIKFKGYNLSLRWNEADMVLVEMLSHNEHQNHNQENQTTVPRPIHHKRHRFRFSRKPHGLNKMRKRRY